MKNPVTSEYISLGNKGSLIHNNLTLKIKGEKVLKNDVFIVLLGKLETNSKQPGHVVQYTISHHLSTVVALWIGNLGLWD